MGSAESIHPSIAGRAHQGGAQRGVLQPVEGLHAVLRPARSPHCAHLHLPGADEHVLLPQHPRRQFWPGRTLKRDLDTMPVTQRLSLPTMLQLNVASDSLYHSP
ncbi:unnamed protein product, partial [Ixodes pacificus]